MDISKYVVMYRDIAEGVLYTIFIYMQFNALLIHCLLFFIPFNVYNYIYHACLYMYYSAFMAAKHNKTVIIL